MEGNKQLSDVRIGGYSSREIRDVAEGYYEDFQERFADVDRRVRETVRARPLACVFGAFAIGYLAAKSLRMWRR